jgi:hypothetical protein
MGADWVGNWFFELPVSGADKGLALPGKEEQYTAIVGAGNKVPPFLAGIIFREDDVTSARRNNDPLLLRVIKLSDLVGEASSGVDDDFRFELPYLQIISLTEYFLPSSRSFISTPSIYPMSFLIKFVTSQ